MPAANPPGLIVLRRYLGSIGGVLAGLSLALYVYAAGDGEAPVSALLLHAAGFGFAHGVALAALAPLAQRPVALSGLVLLLAGVVLYCGGSVAQYVLQRAAVGALAVGAALAISGWLLYAYDRLRT